MPAKGDYCKAIVITCFSHVLSIPTSFIKVNIWKIISSAVFMIKHFTAALKLCM